MVIVGKRGESGTALRGGELLCVVTCFFFRVCVTSRKYVCIREVVVGSTNYQYTVGTLSVCWRDTDIRSTAVVLGVCLALVTSFLSRHALPPCLPLCNVYNGNGEV